MGKRSHQNICLTGLGMLCAVSVASPLIAEEAAVDGSLQSVGGIDEIVITSTRREESIQKISAAVTAFSGDDLKARSIQSVEQIAVLTPGVHIAQYQGDTSIFIRGIGTPVIIAGNDSSTGAYVDGVYYSRAAAVGPAFFDVERIEVLRGPQGTLYGRNATGGAVNIVTKSPTDEFSAEGDLILGNYDRYRLFSAFGGPVTDRIRIRVAGQYENRNGYTTLNSPTSVRDVEDKNDFALRMKVQVDLTNDAMLTLSGDYYQANDAANVFHFGSTGYQEEVPGWLSTREGQQTLPYFAIKNAGNITDRKSRNIFGDVDYFNDTRIFGTTAQLDWAIGEYDLTVIGNYKDSNPVFQNEFDLADTFNNYVLREEDHWQWSADVQISSPADRRFRWIAGGYYFREENDITNNIFGNFWEPILIQGLTDLQTAGVIPIFPVVIPNTDLCCELHLNGEQETKAWAIYGDATFDVTERIAFKFGGRYSWEQRDGRQDFELVVLNPVPGGPTTRFAPEVAFFPNAVSTSREGVQPDPFGFVVAPVEEPAEFSAFTPKFGIDFQYTENVLFYASVQRGFKSGGFNIGSSQRDPFDPETIWAYEGGVKSTLLDGRLRLNAAYFHYSYKNLQAQDSIGNQPIIRNVGRAAVDGFEIETAASIIEGFQIDGGLTYLDARFTQGSLTEPLRPAPLTQAPGTLLRDLEGLRLPRAPEWKFNVGGQYTIPIDALGLGEAVFRMDYGWQSKVFFTVFNIDAASEDAVGVLKVRAALNSEDGRWSVSMFGDNLTDERYFNNLILTGTVYGAEFVGPLAPPRTFGAQIGYKL